MKLVVNGKVGGQYSKLIICASIYEITRSFFFVKNVEDILTPVGSKVLVSTDIGIPIIQGEVEYKEMAGIGEYIYAGRNRAKDFSDAYIEQTVEFDESQTLNDFLSFLALKSGIAVLGNFILPMGVKRRVHEGERVIDVLRWLIDEFGVGFTSDALGNLEILTVPKPSGKVFSRELGNIISGRYISDVRAQYDVYKTISHTPIEVGKTLKRGIEGSSGIGGLRTAIIKSNYCTTEADCISRSKREAERASRHAFVYKLETRQSIEINKVYTINDTIAGVNEPMLCTKVEYEYSHDEDGESVDIVKGDFAKLVT